ncbi:MAG: enoyl-CoA hydratase/isomerase family protein [Dehalococcoidia bacterium]|uniref:enoyl-CoA hydratase/isomerase family protein n=1 Tax=Candidatus Amarobacter glycogenicus TaxID=3140699 RepID=UPI001D1FFCA8|nr:enoyl-CoA hydratase/isomerase family protein [Dehalococcoidia bacterium]MBK8558656.1 enoyl-CoA hydratase/isomerase family protein [Dehalococcoidia bacterium]
MNYEFIEIERDGDVGILRLNRPERMNAMTNEMSAEYSEAFAELNEDSAIGAILITGKGRAFCAGVDISRFEDSIRERDGEKIERPKFRFNWVEYARAAKPSVVAVNGACIGAGLTRVLPCDVRIASERATFSMRFVRVGIVPELASTHLLPQIVGLQAASDLALSGRTIDAHEAERIGLVLRTVSHDDLMPAAVALARDYAQIGPECLRETKALLHANTVEPDIRRVMQREGEALARRRGSAEQREAVTAFREKREPRFR